MSAIKIINKSKAIHIEWLKFLQDNPDKRGLPQYQHVGSIEHHEQYIKEYDIVLTELERERWTPVEDRAYPEDEIDVFVIINQGDRIYVDMDSCFWHGDEWSWRTHWTGNVTHWMLRPTLPEPKPCKKGESVKGHETAFEKVGVSPASNNLKPSIGKELAHSKKPKCKTCGGSERVQMDCKACIDRYSPDKTYCNLSLPGCPTKPCPKCGKEPKPCETCGGLKIVCPEGLLNGGIAKACPKCGEENNDE